MVTIKDIAQRAGVSRGTVDRVLHDRGKVSPQKAEKIRRIADEMGYQPNIAGRGLAARKKHLKLGFVYIKSEHTPFHSVIYESAKQYAQELEQYGVSVTFFGLEPDKYSGSFKDCGNPMLYNMFHSQKMDGWAVVGTLGNVIKQTVEESGSETAPIVVYNMDEDVENKLAFVGCDYVQSGRLACGIAALLTKNRAHVGIVSMDDGSIQSSMARVAGFETEVKERYPQIQIVAKHFVENSKKGREEFSMKVYQMLEEHKDIDVLYLLNPGDYSVCQMVRRAGATRDVRIITNDLVTDWQREMVKNGTIDVAICQEPEKQGVKPLEILFNYLALGIEPETLWYKTELSVRIGQNV